MTNKTSRQNEVKRMLGKIMKVLFSLLSNEKVQLICIDRSQNELEEYLKQMRAQSGMNGLKKIETKGTKMRQNKPVIIPHETCTFTAIEGEFHFAIYVLGVNDPFSLVSDPDKEPEIPEKFLEALEKECDHYVRSNYILHKGFSECIVRLLQKYDHLNFLKDPHNGTNHTKNTESAMRRKNLLAMQTQFLARTLKMLDQQMEGFKVKTEVCEVEDACSIK